MATYHIWAYPIISTKSNQPVEAVGPTAAITTFIEQTNWAELFDFAPEQVEYLLFSDSFESFEVREAGQETKPSLYYCGDGATLLPPGFAGGVSQAVPNLLALLERAREKLQADPQAAELVEEINQVLG